MKDRKPQIKKKKPWTKPALSVFDIKTNTNAMGGMGGMGGMGMGMGGS